MTPQTQQLSLVKPQLLVDITDRLACAASNEKRWNAVVAQFRHTEQSRFQLDEANLGYQLAQLYVVSELMQVREDMALEERLGLNAMPPGSYVKSPGSPHFSFGRNAYSQLVAYRRSRSPITLGEVIHVDGIPVIIKTRLTRRFRQDGVESLLQPNFIARLVEPVKAYTNKTPGYIVVCAREHGSEISAARTVFEQMGGILVPFVLTSSAYAAKVRGLKRYYRL